MVVMKTIFYLPLLAFPFILSALRALSKACEDGSSYPFKESLFVVVTSSVSVMDSSDISVLVTRYSFVMKGLVDLMVVVGVE